MNSKKFSEAMSELDSRYVDEAINYKKKAKKLSWIKWGAMAACLCLCLIAGSLFMVQDDTPAPPASEDMPATPNSRGEHVNDSEITDSNTSAEMGEKINVYSISSVGINADIITKMQDALDEAGWANTECTMSDDYGFVLKGSVLNSNMNSVLSSEECIELAKAFLNDSGLYAILEQKKIIYEFSTSDSEGLPVAYCYFMCEGEHTGAYIRFVFEDIKCVGEVQAYIYFSEYNDTLSLLTFDDAIKNAYKVNQAGELSDINATDYTIKNAELVYINGLPYYNFTGYGINSREYIDGYALAVDITTSEICEQLTEQHLSFKIR